RDDAVALEADIDDDVLLTDAYDASVHDLVLRNIRQRLLDQLAQLIVRGFVSAFFSDAFEFGEGDYATNDFSGESATAIAPLEGGGAIDGCEGWFSRRMPRSKGFIRFRKIHRCGGCYDSLLGQ